jgi:hypothetical protein
MTIFARLERWKEQGAISQEQHAHLASLSRREPLSIFFELNILLYVGVLAFVAGLGWTVTTWSQQLGDVAIVIALSSRDPIRELWGFVGGLDWSVLRYRAAS